MALKPIEREWESIGHEKSVKNPKGAGRQTLKIEWGLVQYLCHIQCTSKEIAAAVGVSYDSLYRKCRHDLGRSFSELKEEWAEGGKASLRHKQWQLAGHNPTMAIFLGKNYLGQTDCVDLVHDANVVQEIVHYGDIEPKQWNNGNKLLTDESEDTDSSL